MTPIEAMAKMAKELLEGPGVVTYESLAFSMICALRDCGVTEGMFDAWGNVVHDGDEGALSLCSREFRAMLDAALTEST